MCANLYCLVTEVHRCEQLAQGCYAALTRVGFEPTTWWLQVQRSTCCATVLPILTGHTRNTGQLLKLTLPYFDTHSLMKGHSTECILLPCGMLLPVNSRYASPNTNTISNSDLSKLKKILIGQYYTCSPKCVFCVAELCCFFLDHTIRCIRNNAFLGRFLRVDVIKWVSNVRPPVRTSVSSQKFLWFQWNLVCR